MIYPTEELTPLSTRTQTTCVRVPCRLPSLYLENLGGDEGQYTPLFQVAILGPPYVLVYFQALWTVVQYKRKIPLVFLQKSIDPLPTHCNL